MLIDKSLASFALADGGRRVLDEMGANANNDDGNLRQPYHWK